MAAYDAHHKTDLRHPEQKGVVGLERNMDGVEEEWRV
jgi:hypothetical protein